VTQEVVVRGKWASRFVAAAIVQGALATANTLFWVIGQLGFMKA
jgi:hypothetical protein